METNENTREEVQQAAPEAEKSAEMVQTAERPTVRQRPVRPAQDQIPSAPQEKNTEKSVQTERKRPVRQNPRQRPAPERKSEEHAKKPKRPAQTGNTGRPAVKNKKKRPAETEYQPYRKANIRKKAKRKSAVRQFFSSENQIVKYFSNLGNRRDVFAEDSEIARKRKAQREAEAARRKRNSAFSAPAVVYTQPASFNRDRLLVQLLTVVAVVLAFVLGLSVFFKVKTITVSGAEVYSPWAIQEASGIKKGDNLLTFGRARAAGQIEANLPYVKNVRIGIKLPDTVNIEIDEEDVVYAIKSEEGIWWLINSSGKVVDMSNNAQAKNYTQVLGVTLVAPQKNAQAIPADEIPTATDSDGEPMPITVTGAQRLNAAMQILRALEANDIVGEAASVDVSRMEDIVLWYGSQYQVNLGDTNRIDYKIACMCDVILQMHDYQSGILDISFTTWSEQVGYTPFQ